MKLYRHPVLLLIFANVMTAGFVALLWLWLISNIVLDGKSKYVNRREKMLIVTLGVIYGIMLILSMIVTYDPAIATEHLSLARSHLISLALLQIIIFVSWVAVLKAPIEKYIEDVHGTPLRLYWLGTLIFTIYYVQFRLNQCLPRDTPPVLPKSNFSRPRIAWDLWFYAIVLAVAAIAGLCYLYIHY